MNADVLRRAADAIHHDLAFGQEHGDEKFVSAVADLLIVASVDWPENPEALAVARAYLGES